MQNLKSRTVSLDITRILAVLGVMAIHASSRFVLGYELDTPEYFWGILFNGVSQSSVPLFVMISGALLLDENKNVTVKSIFRKYIPSALLLFLFWSVFFYLSSNVLVPLQKGREITFENFIPSVLKGHYHMWYLYMLVGLYLATPILRAITTEKNKHLVLLFIGISIASYYIRPVLNVLTKYIPEMSQVTTVTKNMKLDFFVGYPAYYLLGWYLKHVGFRKNYQRYLLYAASVVSMLTMFVYVSETSDEANGFAVSGVLMMIFSAGVFDLLNHCIHWKIKQKTAKLLYTLSSLCFGVYIIHPFFLSQLQSWTPYSTNPFLYITLTFACTAILSFGVCFVLSKIPGVRKIIRG